MVKPVTKGLQELRSFVVLKIKNMKTLLSLLILSILSGNISASGFLSTATTDTTRHCQFGIKVGTNYSGITDKESRMFGSEWKYGLAAGVYFRVPLGRYVGIQPEALYSQKGFKATTLTDGREFNVCRTTNYLDLPLYLSFQPCKVLTILAGPQYSILLQQKNKCTTEVVNLHQDEMLQKVATRRNNVCLLAGFDLNISRAVLGARVGYDAFSKSDGTSRTLEYKNAWVQATIGATLFSCKRELKVSGDMSMAY